MKKLIVLSIIFILPIVFLFFSCFSTEHHSIIDFDVYALKENRERAQDERVSILIFEIKMNIQYMYGHIPNVQPVQYLHATSVPQVIDNKLLPEVTEIRLSGDIYFDGELIAGGTDLWNHPLIEEYRWFIPPATYRYYETTLICIMGFEDEFYEHVTIPDGEYEIDFVCYTDDNRRMERSLTVEIKM